MPDQLSDWSTHRIADRNKCFDSKRISYGNRIVGAVFESKPPPGADAASVPPVIECNDIERAGEGFERAEPIQRRIHGPAMEQHERRGMFGSVSGSNKRGSTARKVEWTPRGEAWRVWWVWVNHEE